MGGECSHHRAALAPLSGHTAILMATLPCCCWRIITVLKWPVSVMDTFSTSLGLSCTRVSTLPSNGRWSTGKYIFFDYFWLGWNDISCTLKKKHAKNSLHWEPVGFSPSAHWVQGRSFRVYCRLKCFWPKTEATSGKNSTQKVSGRQGKGSPSTMVWALPMGCGSGKKTWLLS